MANANQDDWQDVELDDWEDVSAPKPPTAEPTWKSALAGLNQGLTLGFSDEISGGVDALKDVVTGKVAPTEVGQAYERHRDRYRGDDKTLTKQHPAAHLGGEVAGGVATAFVPGVGPVLNAAKGARTASVVGKAALQGGLTGLGQSEADDSAGLARDTTQGAVVGGTLGAGVKAATKLPDVVRGANTYAKAATRGATQGAKEATDAAFERAGPVLGTAITSYTAPVGALKGALKEVVETNTVQGEVKTVADAARRLVLPVVDDATKLPDDEAILTALRLPGENPIKRWWAQKAATVQPGQVDGDQYAAVLSKDSAARNAARSFDAETAAKELEPTVREVKDLFEAARTQRFDELTQQARKGFDGTAADPVLGHLQDALADSQNLKSVPSKVRNTLEDVQAMLTEGRGVRSQGLTAGGWDSASSAERFNRLQQARVLVDKQVRWAEQDGSDVAERILKDFRKQLDDVLKISPEKAEADELFRASKDVEGKFFKGTEFRDAAGNYDVDPYKIARMLGNSDQAKRFRDAVPALEEFAQRPGLNPELQERALRLADQLKRQFDTAADKRALEAFRQKQGPTSPAVERLNSVTNNNSLLQDALSSPAGFVNATDQFAKTFQSVTGKALDNLSPPEQAAATKLWIWLTQVQAKKKPNKFLRGF
jgi:hypothetical protein